MAAAEASYVESEPPSAQSLALTNFQVKELDNIMGLIASLSEAQLVELQAVAAADGYGGTNGLQNWAAASQANMNQLAAAAGATQQITGQSAVGKFTSSIGGDLDSVISGVGNVVGGDLGADIDDVGTWVQQAASTVGNNPLQAAGDVAAAVPSIYLGGAVLPLLEETAAGAAVTTEVGHVTGSSAIEGAGQAVLNAETTTAVAAAKNPLASSEILAGSALVVTGNAAAGAALVGAGAGQLAANVAQSYQSQGGVFGTTDVTTSPPSAAATVTKGIKRTRKPLTRGQKFGLAGAGVLGLGAIGLAVAL